MEIENYFFHVFFLLFISGNYAIIFYSFFLWRGTIIKTHTLKTLIQNDKAIGYAKMQPQRILDYCMANTSSLLFEMQISTWNVKIVCSQLEKEQSYVVPPQYTVEHT